MAVSPSLLQDDNGSEKRYIGVVVAAGVSLMGGQTNRQTGTDNDATSFFGDKRFSSTFASPPSRGLRTLKRKIGDFSFE